MDRRRRGGLDETRPPSTRAPKTSEMNDVPMISFASTTSVSRRPLVSSRRLTRIDARAAASTRRRRLGPCVRFSSAGHPRMNGSCVMSSSTPSLTLRDENELNHYYTKVHKVTLVGLPDAADVAAITEKCEVFGGVAGVHRPEVRRVRSQPANVQLRVLRSGPVPDSGVPRAARARSPSSPGLVFRRADRS